MLYPPITTDRQQEYRRLRVDVGQTGFFAGTYYINLINTNGATTTGIFRARFEERPVGIV